MERRRFPGRRGVTLARVTRRYTPEITEARDGAAPESLPKAPTSAPMRMPWEVSKPPAHAAEIFRAREPVVPVPAGSRFGMGRGRAPAVEPERAGPLVGMEALAGEVSEVSAAMGLPPGKVDVQAAPGLRARTGSRAAARSSTIWVDPQAVPAAPSERRGLLAHELAHVAQSQRAGAAGPVASDDALEHEASTIADEAGASSGPVRVGALAGSPAVMRGDKGPVHVDVGTPVNTPLLDVGWLSASVTVLDTTWNSDHFQLVLRRTGTNLTPSMAYLGPDVASPTEAAWGDAVLPSPSSEISPSLPTGDPGTAPKQHLVLRPQKTLAGGTLAGGHGVRMVDPAVTVDVPRVNHADARHVVIALGEGLPELIVYDDLTLEDAWVPALRRHAFTLHLGGQAVRGGERPFSVRSRDALPANVAKEIAAPMPDTLGATSVSTASLLDVAGSELSALTADASLAFPAGPVVGALHKEIDRRARIARQPATSADDQRFRQGAADLLLAISEARPRLLFLATLSDPNGYFGGEEIGRAAVAEVDAARDALVVYVFAALDGDRGRTAGLRATARAKFARLPFLIADLYLQKGGAFEKLEGRQRELASDIMTSRGHTHSGRRPIDQELGLIPDSTAAPSADELRARAQAVREALERGDPNVLSALMTTTIDAQRKSGLLAIRAAQDQFAYFADELDTVIDDVVGVFGGGEKYNVARGYRDRFDAMLKRVEEKKSLDPATVDRAISDFNAVVSAPSFNADVQAIQSRLKSIAVVRIVAKIVAITAVAAIGGAAVGSAAGAGLSTAARAFALGSRATFVLVRGGSLVAEAGAFTFLSRTGESWVLGTAPERGFGTDFAINLATLGMLRGVNAAWGAWRPAFRATSPRLFAAGGHAAGIASAHLFGELVHVVETGRAMTGEERGLAVAQNLALVGALHLGRYFSQPLEARLTRGVLSLLNGEQVYRGRLAALETARPALVADAMALLGKSDADPAEVGRVLAELEAHFQGELSLLRDAAQYGALPAGEVQGAAASHVRALATLELRFAQEGALSPSGMEATFRPAAPGVVEFSSDPAARAFLEQYYNEQGGTLKAEGDRLVGVLDGRRTQYIPTIDKAGAGPLRTQHAASLEGSLGDLQGSVDVRESASLGGRDARVVRSGGRVVIEVGRDATPEDVQRHLDEARSKVRFIGPLGRLRLLRERVVTLLRLRPGEGTLGAEAAAELVKLRAIRDTLTNLDGGASRGAGAGDAAARLADIERQIEYYERLVGSYERGRGYVAAFDTVPGALADLKGRFPADSVTSPAESDQLVLNDVLSVPRSRLAALDAALHGGFRTNGLEELADLSRALAQVGGDESKLPDRLQQRLAVLKGVAPDLSIQRGSSAPAPSSADPLLLPTATLAQRAEVAAARASRLGRAGLTGSDVATVEALRATLVALAERARSAKSPGEREAVERELAANEPELAKVEQDNRDAVDLLRAEETARSVQHVATDVPEHKDARPRLDEEDVKRIDDLLETIALMRMDPVLFDRAHLDDILRELAGLRARVEAQQAADIARGEREGMDKLTKRERTLYEGGKLKIKPADAKEAGIKPGTYEPLDLDKLTPAELKALAEIVGKSGREDASTYRQDLLERAEKRGHRDRLEAAKKAAGNVDSAVSSALSGAKDVWVGSRPDAETVLGRLRILLQPGGADDAQPSFHGPESHRGTDTAPDAPHFNAEGYYQGSHVDVHIYFGGP
jgi:hypothetical protein